MADRKTIFFSSCFTDSHDRDLPIRERVRAAFNSGDERPVWMAEDYPIQGPASPAHPVDKALFCVKGVQQCEVYVAVVIDKHGSGIEVTPGGKTQTSFLELELFEAAVSGKPAFVFILEGQEPSDRMARLLDLLGPALPGLCLQPMSEDQIVGRIDAILQRSRRPWLGRLGRFAASGSIASDRLGASRHRPYRPAAELPALQFLDDPYDPSLGPPSLNVVETLLASVDRFGDHQSRLAILWLAIRELMGVRPTRAEGDQLLYCWDRALAGWTSTAAWYGLHGFCHMGCLGAIGSRSRILREFSHPPPMPHGPFASEYYSIARKVGDGRLRSTFLDLALEHVEVALQPGASPEPLAIRGSIYWMMGRRSEGIADYGQVIRLREEEGAPDAKIGEAKAELGFALVRSRATRAEGLRLLEEGVELAARGGVDGFLLRAKRKLGAGYVLAGAPRRGLHQLVDAHDLAVTYGLYDQISRIERAAVKVDKLLPFLKAAH